MNSRIVKLTCDSCRCIDSYPRECLITLRAKCRCGASMMRPIVQYRADEISAMQRQRFSPDEVGRGVQIVRGALRGLDWISEAEQGPPPPPPRLLN